MMRFCQHDPTLADETLRQVSEYLSRPAKQFARALGVVDAMSVFEDK